ncbi:U-box domain-containing protein 52-like [Gastrolobium bilobum]|uniref:U-box domain-containing protein 52-like n=1 Tax=Gastrolobium bilobum TaxID=150636 RepID=UPI002AB1BA8C|nr:U-box domain-containing protein 52-like [Gastrolobium bilobum]
MASNDEQGSTVIAIDRDRNSQCAVIWAVDHLLKKNSSCTLIHVRTKALYPHNFDDVPKQGRPPTEEELHQLFLPFRGFCARKGIIAKELVMHSIDVPSVLINYIIDNSISNVVVGASRWNVLIRKFRDFDVPTSLVRSLPESCMVHVISKGGVQNIRPAGRPQNISITPTKSLKDISGPKGKSLLEDLNRKSLKHRIWQGSNNGGASFGQNNDAIQVAPRMSNGETTSLIRPSDENCSSQNSSNRSSINGDTSRPIGSQLTETSHENQDIVENSNTSRNKSSTNSSKSLETEIRKLKLEPKRTSKKNSTAYREAVAAKHKAIEIEKLRQEEKNVEKARLAEEAALQKTKILSKRLEEMKAQKRKKEEIRAMHEEEERRRALNASAHNNIQLRRYNIKEIEVATNYFDISLKIGEGGYGPVFKGVLDDTVVAVKALKPDITQGERQFQQEVNVLSTIRHPNMVPLLGACPEYGCLVYEYMENGSLEDRLFLKDNTPPIPWKTRFKIASEIATGLLYLHQTRPEPVVHRDLKPANILLDRNYVSKITDVGLARLVPPKVPNKTTQYHKTTAAGTFCYIDPEYQQTGLLGVKSDIYSLGIVLLQIITGKPPIGVAYLVDEAINNGKFSEVLDPNVTDWPVGETLSYARLSLKCCEMRKRDRPDLGSIILPELNRLRNLGGATDYDILPARQEGMSNNPNVEMENST